MENYKNVRRGNAPLKLPYISLYYFLHATRKNPSSAAWLSDQTCETAPSNYESAIQANATDDTSN